LTGINTISLEKLQSEESEERMAPASVKRRLSYEPSVDKDRVAQFSNFRDFEPINATLARTLVPPDEYEYRFDYIFTATQR
jgi:hypothetical protein